MSRVQLALNVSDLEASIAFYSRLFNVEPHKVRSGYANFEVAEPALKLVLFEVGEEVRGNGTAGALNHLGVEVTEPSHVEAASARLAEEGLQTLIQDQTTCCHAVQDKVWVHDPAGLGWEIYAITDDAPAGASDRAGDGQAATGAGATCCEPEVVSLTTGGDAEAAREPAACSCC